MALDVKSLEGNEIADDYVRTAGTEGRFAAAWSVFKGSFGKVVLINLLMLVFFAPSIAILVVRNMFINVSGYSYPFNANTGLGYPANPGALGLTEQIYLTADLVFYSMLIAGALIASIGFAGGIYSIKKLLNTNGKFTFKGFFHGIKIGYFKTALPVTLFSIFYFACVIIGDWKDLVIATGGSGAGPITAYVFIIIATVLVGLYCAWLLATGLSYRLKFSTLIKTSFRMLISTPLQTVFFAAFALMPVWAFILSMVLLGSGSIIFVILAGILLLMLVLFGLSYVALVWMGYTQWIFDSIIAPKIKTEEKNKKEEIVETEEEREKRIARELLAAGRSELIGKPILPIGNEIAIKPLGASFTRADIEKIAEGRSKLCGDVAAYENAHKNDRVYAEYNKMFADREKALQPEGKNGKKKKVSSQNLLKR